jgi:hypothetical protein
MMNVHFWEANGATGRFSLKRDFQDVGVSFVHIDQGKQELNPQTGQSD